MNLESNYSSLLLSWVALITGLALLTGGGEMLVAGASRLAKRLGMSSLLVGLTVVAFGTSMPELFVGIISLFQDHPDILTGNVIGSNIANVGLILGICAIITPLPVKFRHVSLELYMVLAASLLIFVAAWLTVFTRMLGLIFVAALIFYTVLSFRSAVNSNKKRKKEGQDTGEDNNYPLAMIITATLSGLICLPIGSNFFIRGAVDVARQFGVSELIIGLTLAAIGTSLPELASCLAAIRQRQTSILAGNIIGSNLFNLLMVLGLCGLLAPYPMSSVLLYRDIPVMFSFSAVLLPILAVHHGLSRRHGTILFLAYAGYLFILR